MTLSVSVTVAASKIKKTFWPMLKRCSPSPCPLSLTKYSTGIAMMAKTMPIAPCQKMIMPELISLSALLRVAFAAKPQDERTMSA